MRTNQNYFILFPFIVFIIFSQNMIAQKIEIPLTERVSILDDGAVQVTPFINVPKRNLKLPLLDLSKAMYFELMYCWFFDRINWNRTTYVMVVPEKDGDRLYVDYNADDELTNDGEPLFFPFKDYKIFIDLSAPGNKDQYVRYSFCRKRKPNDTAYVRWIDNMFDKNGNLNQYMTSMYSDHYNGFTGKKGTFYFDEPITIAKGQMKINEKNHVIGLYDYNLNGLFNDKEDLLLTNINNDGKLELEEGAFRLNDVFEIDNKRFKIDHVDPYGRNITLVETNEEPTFYYLKEIQSQELRSGSRGILDSSFWSHEYKTISGDIVKLNTFKGKYLLLNFWGEWCVPCLAEIPELVEGYKKFPHEKLEIISLLNTSNLEKAKKVIFEKGILWPQIEITNGIIEKFKVHGYPTNILIYPDGINYFQLNIINRTFFDEYIK